jgi:SAM-dependent methyltransferase
MLHPAALGTLRRTTPHSDRWGFDRGTPVDRYYIDRFLEAHGADVRGRVLEVKDSGYTRRYGSAVVRADVLDVDASNAAATVVADLTAADHVPTGSYDCFILTQTLHFIYDMPAAVRHAHRILAPGGVLLATLPCVSRVLPSDAGYDDYWRLTAPSASRLFGDVFGPEGVEVHSHGNVLACVAFLSGLAWEELPRRKLDVRDAHFPLLVTVRAVKGAGAAPA